MGLTEESLIERLFTGVQAENLSKKVLMMAEEIHTGLRMRGITRAWEKLEH